MSSNRQSRLNADERRTQIIEAARTVFSRSGLAGTRTRDIAREAGINEAILYRHFSSKMELFEAAVAQPLEDAVADLVAEAGTPRTEFSSNPQVQERQVLAFVRQLADAMDGIGPLLGVVLFGDSEVATDYFQRRILPSLKRIEEVVEANLAVWPHRDFDAELIVQMLFGTTWFLSLSESLSGRRRDRDQTAEQIMLVLMKGLELHPAEAVEHPTHSTEAED